MAKRKQTKATKENAREVKRLARLLLRDFRLRPEVVAVRAGVTVYTVYRWAKGTTGSHSRHLAVLQRLVAAEQKKRSARDGDCVTP
jgi:hypothetical protein